MVDIAQMVEHRIVAPSVVGSIPTIHPKTRAWCNGNTPVSKTVDRSSTLLALAIWPRGGTGRRVGLKIP